MPDPLVYVVLGMHKSGTSLIASALHTSGIRMVPPEQNIPGSYDAGAKYEWHEFKMHNHSILGSKPGDSLGIDLQRRFTPDVHRASAAKELVERTLRRFTHWGFKDPATTLVYSFWRTLLPPHRIITVYRRPDEVSMHYARQTAKQHCSRAAEAAHHWATYNTAILNYSVDAMQPMLLVNYGQLFKDDNEWSRLQRFTQRQLMDVRQSALYRCVANSELKTTVDHQENLDCGAIWRQLESLRMKDTT